MRTRFIIKNLFILSVTISMALTGCTNFQSTSDLQTLQPADNISYSQSNSVKNTANGNIEQHLQNYYWTLESLKDNYDTNKNNEISNALNNFDNVEMRVISNKISFKLCHTFIADFDSMPDDKSLLKVSDYRIIPSMCDEEVQNFEYYLATRMLDVNEFNIKLDEPYHATLTQNTYNGLTLVWKGSMTESARFGEGEILIWEVDKDTYPCDTQPNHQCLKVRDIRFDEDWHEKTYGEWRLFSQQIKGFEHHKGAQTVLIIKKYAPAPNTAPIYVLEHIREWNQIAEAVAVAE